MSNLPPGEVRGTIEGDGNVVLSIELPSFPRTGAETTFVGQAASSGAGWDGVLDWKGRFERVTLEVIEPGATDDHGVPLVASTRHENVVGDCALDVLSAEFFGLAHEPLERTLNAFFQDTVESAPSACASGVETIAGGGTITLLRQGLVSVAAEVSRLAADEYVEVDAPVRHTYEMASGRELALFGDVLAPATEGELRPLLAAAVARIDDAALTDSERDALDRLLADALREGRLARRFGLSDGGVVFDAPELAHRRIRHVEVPYDAFGAALVIRPLL